MLENNNSDYDGKVTVESIEEYRNHLYVISIMIAIRNKLINHLGDLSYHIKVNTLTISGNIGLGQLTFLCDLANSSPENFNLTITRSAKTSTLELSYVGSEEDMNKYWSCLNSMLEMYDIIRALRVGDEAKDLKFLTEKELSELIDDLCYQN